MTQSRTDSLLVQIPIAQVCLSVFHRDFLARDKYLLYVRLHVEEIAGGDDEICGLAHIERSQTVSNAPNLCRIDGDSFQCFVGRKAERSGETGLVWEVPRIVSIVGGKCDLYASLVQLRRKAVYGVISLFRLGFFVYGAHNYRDMETGNIIEYGLRMVGL